MFKLNGTDDSFLKSLSSKDRSIFIICGILGIVCSLLLTPYFDDTLEFYNNSSSNEPVIGKIVYKTNTVQVKNYQQMIWQNAKKNQDIRTGDSVFSGEKSLTQIQINNSNKIVLGENSLILFQVIKSDKVANLKDGNFRISVNGDIKVAINGKLAEIKGDKSEIQVFISEDNKPQIKLLSGNASVTDENGSKQELTEGTVTQFNPKTTEEVAIAVPRPNQQKSKINYTWKLFDLYEKTADGTYKNKISLPATVKLEKKIDWSVESENQSAVVEISGQMDFSDKKTFTSNQNGIILSDLFPGKNYWRVRNESSNEWSPVSEFEVETIYKGQTSLQNVSYERKIPLINNIAESKLVLQNQKHSIGYIVETSTTADFSSSVSASSLITDGKFPVNFERPGSYYYRIRSVSEEQEVSDWSPIFKTEVYIPQMPLAPTLKLAKSEVTLPEPVEINLETDEQQVFVEIRNEYNQIVKREQSTRYKDTLSPGHYTATAYAVDQFGRVSPASAPVQINVSEASPVLAQSNLAANNEQSLTLDMMNSTSSSKFYNASYKESKFSINTFMWNLFSSQQLANNSANPSITGLGANIMHWSGQNGVEGQIKNGLSSSTGSQSSLSSVEAKYHYRYNTSFPGEIADELQYSVFAGVESYRNSGNSIFSNKYEILKAGLNMNVPIRETWSAGGQVALGYGLDSSKKYELSGEVNHYFNKLWSLGLGYKIHLFEAGSTSSSGNGTLPYREGYTESSLLLNYDY